MKMTMVGAMRTGVGLVALGWMGLPALAAPMTYKDVSVVDVECSKHTATTAAGDKHTRDCALDCADSGFAIITADDKVVKLDKAGNEKMAAALKESKAVDHVRVNVSGEQDGDVLKVTAVKVL
jgi:hypothetical protein